MVSVNTLPYGQLVTVGAQLLIVRMVVVVIVSVV
jgi:hypothetical protein